MLYNICCFTRVTFAHELKGGMELHTRVLSEKLVDRGHRVTILTTSLQPMKELIQNENGVELHYLPVTIPARYSKEFLDLSVKRFEQLHQSKPFDVIWSESLGAIGYIKNIKPNDRLPIFIKMQGSLCGSIMTSFRAARSLSKKWPIILGYNLPGLFLQFIKWQFPMLKESGMIVCPSPQTASEIRKETLIKQSKLFISVNGIDVNQFRPDQILRQEGRKLLSLTKNHFLIFNAGRLSSDKGIHILLKAVVLCSPQIHNLVVAIAGVGDELNRLQISAKSLGIEKKVQFIGFIPNENLPVYYNASDLFVCPTVRVESFGIVIAEAMACGKPVISSASGGTKYLVEDKSSGLLVPPGDVEALAKSIIKVYSTPKLATKLGKHARRRAVEHLSSERMVNDTEYVIDRLVKKNPN
jgi:glycosyltransferase involved in cell wall biosynthesis